MKEKIAVIGAGAWGTALALLLADNGHDVSLWMFEQDLAEETARTRENRVYLPGFTLPPSIAVTSSLETAIKDRATVLSVVPSHTVRTVVSQFAPLLAADAVIVSASKGLEIDTLLPLSEVFKDVLPKPFHNRLCFLSGPSFAKEVARKLPTAVTLASYDPDVGKRVQTLFSSPYFRVYTNADVIGVELGGSLKNVIAIAAGVLEGLGYGYNTAAALLTRGLAEMARLGAAMGANPLTFSGLAGMGDLVLTCTGSLSRNRTLGERLGKGEKLDEILAATKTVAEGVKTAKAALDLAKKYSVEMPIVEGVYQLLYKGKKPKQAVQELMGRELKGE
ncbi:MAG TPA: NAD(P)H-dependent glycerol-3-phosphate dehydrogenase [Nitrospiraceae bacterium]|nr:NAD(P)H-dependent glycerol-3-phosphate dehydrogenase [Nitrospiraceae bacterium]